MILHSHIYIQKFSQLAPKTILEFGMLKADKNYSVSKCQDLKLSVSTSLTTERVSFQDGMMERSEPSFLNLESSSTTSMMLIIMELLLLLPPATALESSLEVWKEKSESGKLEDKLKLWKLPLKSTEQELTILKLKGTMKWPYLLHQTDHASFGT